MTIEHISKSGGSLQLLQYPVGCLGRKECIGVIEPGEYYFGYENCGPVELVIADENGEIEIIDASWDLDPEDDRVIRGGETVFQLKKPGQWVSFKCEDYVEIRLQ